MISRANNSWLSPASAGLYIPTARLPERDSPELNDDLVLAGCRQRYAIQHALLIAYERRLRSRSAGRSVLMLGGFICATPRLLVNFPRSSCGPPVTQPPQRGFFCRNAVRPPALVEHRARQAGFLSAALPQSKEVTMYSKLLAIVSAGVLMMAGTAAWAQSSTAEKPGHIMQRTPQAKSTGPGASEYAPGHLKRKSQSASKFTPSRKTTTTTTGQRTR